MNQYKKDQMTSDLKQNEAQDEKLNLLSWRSESSAFHSFESSTGSMLFDVETGKIVRVSSTMQNIIEQSLEFGDIQRANLMASMFGINPVKETLKTAPESVPVRSFSLAVAQKCNLGCTYCYAEKGTFGGRQKNMDLEVAFASVDALLKDIKEGEKINIAFMGGEPLMNRSVIYPVCEYAAQQAKKHRISLGFSITTNATLIRSEDIELFNHYRFTVTVSIDGLEEVNDKLRPYISGKGSFNHVRKKLKELLDFPNRLFLVFGRVTVTPKNLKLVESMQGLLEMGFDSLKFSPMLKSPTGKEEMNEKDFVVLLEQMTACGDLFKQGIEKGKIYPVSNITNMLKRIHNYQREQYPCGAGGGYMGVSAEGNLYACHRFVNDSIGHLGDVELGVDPHKQSKWLQERNLNAQGACTTCWARYLCSGSCHHEVIKRGRPACGYIKGWLSYCLSLYADLSQFNPEVLHQILHQSAFNEENIELTE